MNIQSGRVRNVAAKTLVSLFSGCGGMDIGFGGGFDVPVECVNEGIHPDWVAQNRGNGWVTLKPNCFQITFANDISKKARAAWVPYFAKRHVNPGVFFHGSIVDLVKTAEHTSASPLRIPADIVTGGFPCQDFSVAGKRKGFRSHKSHRGDVLESGDEPTLENRGTLYMWMRDVIELVRPKVFVAENVKGLVSLPDAKAMIERDFREMGESGYLVHAKLLRAADYGVPQARERIIFIGFLKSALRKEAVNPLMSQRVPERFDPFPVPTHTDLDGKISVKEAQFLRKSVTARQLIGDLPEPEESEDLSQKAYSKARWYGKHCQGQTEVNLDGLGPTIRAEHHGNIEYRRLSQDSGGKNSQELADGLPERRLTVRECARLQTFPDDYEFVRNASDTLPDSGLSPSDGYRLIGNALPPLFAYNIARRIQDLWPLVFMED